jgi:hypothetical protein
LGSENSDTREGVCIGMSEIMSTASKTQLVDFVQHCLPSIRRALVDSESEVREAAAHAFDMLHHHLGPKAVDEVLPALLHELKTEGKSSSSNFALEALVSLVSGLFSIFVI